jgi:hypothetical protein
VRENEAGFLEIECHGCFLYNSYNMKAMFAIVSGNRIRLHFAA